MFVPGDTDPSCGTEERAVTAILFLNCLNSRTEVVHKTGSLLNIMFAVASRRVRANLDQSGDVPVKES